MTRRTRLAAWLGWESSDLPGCVLTVLGLAAVTWASWPTT